MIASVSMTAIHNKAVVPVQTLCYVWYASHVKSVTGGVTAPGCLLFLFLWRVGAMMKQNTTGDTRTVRGNPKTNSINRSAPWTVHHLIHLDLPVFEKRRVVYPNTYRSPKAQPRRAALFLVACLLGFLSSGIIF